MPKMKPAAALLEEALKNARASKFRAGFAANESLGLYCHVYPQNRGGREVFYNKWELNGERVSKARAFEIEGAVDA